MTSVGLLNLHTLIAGYPSWAPGTLADLVSMFSSEMKELCDENAATQEQKDLLWGMRKHAIAAKNQNDQLKLASATDVKQQLTEGLIAPGARMWLGIALNPDRTRVLLHGKNGSRYYPQVVTKTPPTPERLAKVTLPPGGTWVLLFGGSPDWVNDHEMSTLLTTVTDADVSEVWFMHLQAGQRPTHYSTRGGVVVQGRNRLPLPDRLIPVHTALNA